MNNWETLFGPVLKQGREIREGQALLGNAIIDVIENGGSLLGQAGTGTGKSFATLIPIMCKVLERKAQGGRQYRGVVSTETNTLLAQLVEKDLPFLSKLYPGVSYRKLMGRSNYVCLNVAKDNSKTDVKINGIYQKLEARISNLGDGEKADAERVLGRKLDRDEWDAICGSSSYCGENQCSSDKCFCNAARAKALTADIVITNHALLATDTEMKLGDAMQDGLLGPIDCLVVDEGHKLEPVLVDQWTKKLNDWELREMSGSVSTGLQYATPHYRDTDGITEAAGFALAGLEDMLKNILRFFVKLAEKRGEEWDGYSEPLSLKMLSSNDSSTLLTLMAEYEVENPKRIATALDTLEKTHKFLFEALKAIEDQGIKASKRKIRKGITASKNLTEILGIMQEALQTKEGIVNHFGYFGCIVDGWKRFNGEPGMTVRLVPLDVSPRAKMIWEGVKTPVLLSATLTDLTDGTFRYARDCVAFPPGKEIKVESPFDLQNQQLIYVTNGQGEKADVRGAQFSMDELLQLIQASKGRALVLFTSRRELDWAAAQARQAQMYGNFPWTILVQEKDSDKGQLAADFKRDTHSVLFATKSFFTGFDAPGETLSMVAICKFPLPRYSVECRQQISHWRSRGFPQWYTRAALTDLEQAFGRLVRSTDCKGVLALLDHRAVDEKSNVFKTAHLGLTSVGSPITLDINHVTAFLNN